MDRNESRHHGPLVLHASSPGSRSDPDPVTGRRPTDWDGMRRSNLLTVDTKTMRYTRRAPVTSGTASAMLELDCIHASCYIHVADMCVTTSAFQTVPQYIVKALPSTIEHRRSMSDQAAGDPAVSVRRSRGRSEVRVTSNRSG